MPNEDPPRDFADWIGLSVKLDWTKSRLLGGAVGVSIVVFSLFLLGAAIWLIVASLQASASSTPGATLGAGGLIIALLGAPFLIWNTVIKQKALNFQKEGHITDRISKAVEQLGAEKTVKRQRINEAGKRVYEKDALGNPDFTKPVSEEVTVPNIEVRLGGVFSLERIAQDSVSYDKGRDHIRVMEILCAYVRENARALNLVPTPDNFEIKKPRLDVQKSIDTIKRRTVQGKVLETNARYRLDLSETNFDGCDLSSGDFTAAIFWRSRFEGANLEKAKLTGAQMSGCLLNFVRWHDAELTGTSMDQCILNRPEPHRGGMNTSSPIFAKVTFVSVIASDLRAMDYFSENPDIFFGTKDTLLCDDMDSVRSDASKLFSERQTAEYRNNADKIVELDEKLKDNPFKYWAPYAGSDLAISHLRSQRFEALGLRGWPYQD